MTAVLDASAVLALIYREPGHNQVAELLAGAMVSTVNWAEIVHKLAQRAHPHPATAADGVRALGVRVEPFTTTDAVRAGLLWTKTHHAALSLGDRACLALTQRVPDGRAITADRAWANLNLDIAVHLIR